MHRPPSLFPARPAFTRTENTELTLGMNITREELVALDSLGVSATTRTNKSGRVYIMSNDTLLIRMIHSSTFNSLHESIFYKGVLILKNGTDENGIFNTTVNMQGIQKGLKLKDAPVAVYSVQNIEPQELHRMGPK